MDSNYLEAFKQSYKLPEDDSDNAPAAPGTPYVDDFKQRFDANAFFGPDEEMFKSGASNAPASDLPWDLNQAVFNGLLLGNFPRMDARVRSMLGQGDYENLLTRENMARKGYRESNPITSMLGEGGGSVLPLMLATRAGLGGLEAASEAGILPSITGAIPRGLASNNWLMRGAAGAPVGAAQGAALTGLTDNSTEGDAIYGALTNAVLNMLLGPAGSAVKPEMRALVQRLTQRGIQVEPGMIPGASPMTRPFAATTPEHIEQLNAGLARDVGLSNPEISKPILRQHMRALGSGMDAIENQFGIPMTNANVPQLFADVRANAAARFGPNSPELGKVNRLVSEAEDAWTGGTAGTQQMAPKGLSGQEYHNLVKRGSNIDTAARDPVIGPYAQTLQGGLKTEWLRALPPAQQSQWQTLMRQYANTQRVFPAANESGTRVDWPTLVRQVGSASNKTRNPTYVNFITDLADAYSDLFKPNMPKPGAKPPESALESLGKKAGTYLGAFGLYDVARPFIESTVGNYTPEMAIAGVGLGAKYGLGKLLSTPMGRNLLLNGDLRYAQNPLFNYLTINKPIAGNQFPPSQ